MFGVSMGVERGVRVGAGFGGALKERRLGAGMTEARLATALGVRLSEVRAWERGSGVPEAPIVRRLAGLLRLDSVTAMDWLEMAGVDLGATAGREVSIQLLSGDAPADPFGDHSVVVDLTEPTRLPRLVPPLPAPPRKVVPMAVVFPEPGSPVYVYSDSVAEPIQRVRRTNRRRLVVTTLALIGLGLVLWWAFGELGSGLSSVIDLLPDTAGVLLGF